MKSRQDEITNNKYVSFKPFKRPLPFRLLNPIENISLKRGKSLINMSPDYLIDMAVKKTNLTDWGNEPFLEPLKILIKSLEEDAQLDLLGRFIFRAKIFGLLCNRLYIQDEINRHPEILNEKIQKPLFIIGHPRTGTTMLHNLLSQDPLCRWLRHWEAIAPSLNPKLANRPSDPRIKTARLEMWFLKKYIPELIAVHPMSAEGPEECHYLLSHTFICDGTFETLANIPQYNQWLRNQDKTSSYLYYKKILQLLQWHNPGEHWVLKSPDHMMRLNDLLKVFPDAKIILTNRDLMEVIPSCCSLVAFARGIHSKNINLHNLGKEAIEDLEIVFEKSIKDIKSANPKSFYNLNYTDLIKDPIEIIRHINVYFGYYYTNTMEKNMLKWLARNKQNKHGIHNYSLEQFGLKSEDIEAISQAYLNQLNIPSKNRRFIYYSINNL
ncbi:MAG: sulfotransferase [Bacteroidales bacterium]|nr:sulfotransferase [Bacteroidales bacterium]